MNKLFGGLAVVVVVAGAIAYTKIGAVAARASADNQVTASRAPAKAADIIPAAVQGAAQADASESGGELVSGEVVEVIQVPKYTYLRLSGAGVSERWVAISTTPIEKGQKVSILAETTMTNFESPSLRRTFSEIKFGTLHQGGCVDSKSHGQGSDCAGKTADTDAMPVVKAVARATGQNSHNVAEIKVKRRELAGKRIRLRAVVVKVTLDVLGKTYLHVRDGSGDEKASTNDLAVTTSLRPNKGDTLLIEGTLAIDQDLGSGYRFDAILENAEVVP